MITYLTGNLLKSPAQVLVNTVNVVGVMGKGIAAQFKSAYPDMFEAYREHCESGELTIGKLFLYKTPNKWILNFPTKKHWRQPSQVAFIESGLRKFTEHVDDLLISSIAFPELGCGNGGLDFETQVKPIMEKYLGRLSIPTLIYINQSIKDLPEHEDISNVPDWLRSEPSSLPFSEVSVDLIKTVNMQRNFETFSRKNSFDASITPKPLVLTIQTKSNTLRITQEELLDFWQQLRDYGLIYGSISADHRMASYLIPLFAKLPYVERVQVSGNLHGLKVNPENGLQVLPPRYRESQIPSKDTRLIRIAS